MSTQPNGANIPMLNQSAISTLGLINEHNVSDIVQEYPDLFKPYYIMAQEARGNIKQTSNEFFETRVDDTKPFIKFTAKTAITGTGAGASVEVELHDDSYLDEVTKTLSAGAEGHMFTGNLSGIQYEATGYVKTTAGAYKVTLNPTDSSVVAEITAGEEFLWKGRQSAEEGSDIGESEIRGEKLRKQWLSIIRTDDSYTDVAMLEQLQWENGKSYYDMDRGYNGKGSMTDRHLFSTEDQLMLGEERNNIKATNSRNSKAKGLVPNIKQYGTDMGNNVDINDAFFRTVARSSFADGFSRKFDILGHYEFNIALEAYLDTKINAYTERSGLSPIELNFGFGEFNIHGLTYNYKEYDLFNTALTHGANPDSYLAGAAVFIPQGEFKDTNGDINKFFTVRYQSRDGWGTTKMMTDGGMLGNGVKAIAQFSLISYKGIETKNIKNFKYVKAKLVA